MLFAVELYFDNSSKESFLDLWKVISNNGLQTINDGISQPHITLGVWNTLDSIKAREQLVSFAKSITPFDVDFASIGIFTADKQNPNNGSVLYLAPVVTQELLETHKNFHDRNPSFGQGPWEHYSPGSWVPHSTIGLELNQKQLVESLKICLDFKFQIKVKVESIGLIEYQPAKLHCQIPIA
ncbi:2'-5' RNA ligase family protein [Bdellovibrionota bacterium]